ncbi:methyltransferase domain-containing protein [Streptomyces violascens]|uniref:protein-L-isoaspartate(D-aspartate) O-methyltransferase n=1 Tax=Streptomyces violascens TaxID=67381 RepID=UPI0036AC3FB7
MGARRHELVDQCFAQIDQLRGGYFHDRPELRAAFAAIPREHFVPARVWWHRRGADGRFPVLDRTRDPERWLQAVYTADAPLITQIADGAIRAEDGPTACDDFTSSISCPSVVVNMLHHLNPRPGDRILEIGTGTGYNAALLAHLVGAANLVTLESSAPLAERARATLAALANGGPMPEVVVADGELGHKTSAPYTGLISTASVQEVPAAWPAQIAEGGVIVVPVATPFGTDALARLVCDGKGSATGSLVAAVSFMRVRGQRQPRPWRELGWPRLPDFELSTGPQGQRVHQR